MGDSIKKRFALNLGDVEFQAWPPSSQPLNDQNQMPCRVHAGSGAHLHGPAQGTAGRLCQDELKARVTLVYKLTSRFRYI